MMETNLMAEPRDGSIALGGIPWLARMTDKARLEAAGEIDRYDLEYPCPMDSSLLSQLGLDARDFQQMAVSSQSDQELLEKLQAKGVPVKV
jgi:hypothetical protein